MEAEMMEIYLTKMILNPRSRKVRRDVGNSQEMHHTISNAFPETNKETTPRQKYGILYRLETDNRNGRVSLLVQSNAEPDWSRLEADYLQSGEGNPACKRIGENYARVASGMKLMFRLRANPTKRIGKSDGRADDRFKPSDERKTRRRVELRTDEDKIAWLKRKGEESGFRLTNVRLNVDVENVASIEQEKISFGKRGNSSPLTFGSVLFEGILEVTDDDKFRESLICGIGTGKAYGFGLLSIAPVKEN
jgi:CRISPR system Cascade subunit CasE